VPPLGAGQLHHGHQDDGDVREGDEGQWHQQAEQGVAQRHGLHEDHRVPAAAQVGDGHVVAVALFDAVRAAVGERERVRQHPRHSDEREHPGDRARRGHGRGGNEDGVVQGHADGDEAVEGHDQQEEGVDGSQRVHKVHLGEAGAEGHAPVIQPVSGDYPGEGHRAEQHVVGGQVAKDEVGGLVENLLAADKHQDEEVPREDDQVQEEEDDAHQALIFWVESGETEEDELCDLCGVAGCHYNSGE